MKERDFMKTLIFRVLILGGFSLLIILPASSQNYYFRNYSARDGLPFIQVYTIFQDSHGNLWTGGYGGLSKFDGRSFTNYSPKKRTKKTTGYPQLQKIVSSFYGLVQLPALAVSRIIIFRTTAFRMACLQTGFIRSLWIEAEICG